MLQLRTLNKAIDKVYPGIYVAKHYDSDSFYLTTDDDAKGTKMAGLYTTTIDVYRLNHLTLEQWMNRVQWILGADFKEPIKKKMEYAKHKTKYQLKNNNAQSH